MRAVRLALFGIIGLVVVLGGLALALGWRPSNGTLSTPAAQPAVETDPTALAEPTLTSDERAIVKAMDARAESMIAAVHDFQALSQETRATLTWKTKVRTAAAIMTGGQAAIQQAALPARYGPLKTRAKEVTDQCGAAVTSLPAVDALTVAAVAAIDPQLVICERDLKRLQLSLSGL